MFPAKIFCVSAALASALSTLHSAPPGSLIGSLVNTPLGTPLSPSAGTPADVVTKGSPALVIGEQTLAGKRWLRLLAADGSSGWSVLIFPQQFPVKVTTHDAVSDHSPDDPSAMESKTLEGPLGITGASEKSAVASLEQLMLPPERNWYLTPWLKLTAKNGMGWSAPAELSFWWSQSVTGEGFLRPPFTAQYTELNEQSPPEGQRVLRVDEAWENTTESKVSIGERWPRIHAILFDHLQPQAILFAHDNTRVLRLTARSQTAFLVFNHYLPELDRVVCDTTDAGKTDLCLVQLTALNGDGHFTCLWAVFFTAGKNPRAKSLPLEAGSGEASEPVSANWWWDRQSKLLGVLRADAQGEKAIVYQCSRINGFVPVDKGVTAAFLEAKNNLREARAERIALTNNQLDIFPLHEKDGIKWFPARLFSNREEAQRWKESVSYGAAVQILQLAGEETHR